MSIVSNNIKYLRRLNGLTQEQFARKIGIKRSLLGAYEEARANPNLTNLKNMAHAFGVSVDNLLKNDLRKIRETPDLGLPYSSANGSPAPPLMRETSVPVAPQPLSAVINRFQPPRPTLRMVARPIALKPLRQNASHQSSPQAPSAPTQPLVFNNHFEDSFQAKTASREEAPVAHQTIQWVRKSEEARYLTHYQNSSYLNQLPVFQLPNLPSGHYRAFEAGADFEQQGSLLIGTFVRNWFEIRDNTRYIVLTRSKGVLCRIIFNQVKAQGTLLLRSDVAGFQDIRIDIKDVLEVWEIKAYVSLTLPSPKPAFDSLKRILTELRDELNRTDLPNNFLS